MLLSTHVALTLCGDIYLDQRLTGFTILEPKKILTAFCYQMIKRLIALCLLI